MPRERRADRFAGEPAPLKLRPSAQRECAGPIVTSLSRLRPELRGVSLGLQVAELRQGPRRICHGLA